MRSDRKTIRRSGRGRDDRATPNSAIASAFRRRPRTSGSSACAARGAIRSTAALIDPKAVGKTLLAFVHVDTKGWGKTPELLAIAAYPEVEEIHSVAGDTCMLLKVRTEDTRALEGLLARLYDTPGVNATRSYVVLSTYLERPVQPGITSEWPTPRHMAQPLY